MNQQEIDIRFMELAYKEAIKAREKDEIPVGAILVDENNNVIAKGHNLKEKNKSAIDHAEIIVIKKATKKLNTWHLDKTTLYVTLEPCLMCVGAIVWSRIKRIVFGAYDKKGGMVISNINGFELKGLNHKVEFIGGILQEKCEQILTDYFKELREQSKK